MKNNCLIILVFALLIPQIIGAQGIIYLSNLNQTIAGSNPAANDSLLAAGFLTGNNATGYLLDSVQIGLGVATGSPGSLEVLIYGNNGNPAGETPGNSLGALAGTLNPVTAGNYTYTPQTTITLLPHTQYYVVLTSSSPSAAGAYTWDFGDNSGYVNSGNWVGNVTLGSKSGTMSSWGPLASYPNNDFSMFSLEASPAPEPSIWSLILLGGGVLVYGRCLRKN